jgi:hypothetical protein
MKLVNPSIRQCALAIASLALVTSSSHSAVIFTDAFASGTGDWYTGGSTGTLANSSGQLSWTPSAVNDVTRTVGRSFTPQTLAVGETIRISFDYTQNAATASDIIRVGLYDVANPISANEWSTAGTTVGGFAGYYGFFRDNDFSNPNLLRTDSGTDTTSLANGPTMSVAAATFSTIAGQTTTFNIVQSTQYQAVYELTRTSSTVMSSVFKLSSGVTTHQLMTGSTLSGVFGSSFDTVVIRPNGPILLDNIQVSVIPEPSAALIGGLGLIALLRRRR